MLTGSSVSNSTSVSGENGKSLALKVGGEEGFGEIDLMEIAQ